MKNLNPNSWYRIPGYNGYEYCISQRLVRSMKNAKKKPGYILKFKDSINEGRVWTLTSDENERKDVSEKDIMDSFNSAECLVDGTYTINLAGRRHLFRKKGQFQNIGSSTMDVYSTKSSLADFSGLVVEEKEEKLELPDFSGLFS